MKKVILFIAIILFVNYNSFAQSKTLELNTQKSQLQWTGKAAFSSYSLSGTIAAKTGTLSLENNEISAAKITVNTKTIASSTKQLEKHLKSDDFFAVKQFPEAFFELCHINSTSEGAQIVKAWLTIKEQKAAFECPITIQITEEQVLVKGTAIINRTTYGINHNSPSIFASLKDNAIADEFELVFELVFE